jgi:diacylglycerol O-acyltransferase / wax synthase
VAVAELLSPADLSALQAERGPVRMHVGGLLVLDAPVAREAVVGRIVSRLHLIPRYRMRLSDAGALANVRWVEDEGFDPSRHVRRAALPEPGTDAELCELVGDLMSDPLDRTRPLWQIHVIEGLSDGRGAVLARMHHALVDGISAVDVSTVILDPTPEGIELPPPDPAEPEERRGRLRVEQLARLAAGQLELPVQIAREAAGRRLSLDPRHAARQVRDAADTVAGLARIRPGAPRTRLNAEIGRDRAFAVARGTLDDVKRVRRATGATVNDVLLTTVALMLSEFLGEEAPDRAVALVPVSIRREDERGELGNRLSMVFADLPLAGSPLERLERVSEEMREAREDPRQVRAGAFVVNVTGLAEPLVSSRLTPPIVSSVALRALSGPAVFNLVVSNVPGPQQTFYLAGTPVREVFPAVPLNPRNQALSVGILSYDGGVYYGLLADRDAVPDVADAATGIERALGALVATAG